MCIKQTATTTWIGLKAFQDSNKAAAFIHVWRSAEIGSGFQWQSIIRNNASQFTQGGVRKFGVEWFVVFDLEQH